MILKYSNELEGQEDFYSTILTRVNKELTLDDVFVNNTDGVVNGNILEFKLIINDLNATLFQVVKYLSQMRIRGKSIPKNILLISLNETTAYLYDSQDYFDEIHKVYIGASSKNNVGFISKEYKKKLNYSNHTDGQELINLLKQENYMKINIDENCIVGWAERYYNENPSAQKADFIGDLNGKIKIVGEIRNPEKFKNLINPYVGETNVKFQWLMDKLNDNLQKKNLGAFYTPLPYVEKSLELLRKAIARVPEGNDYIILDRCAGTGNLEKLLTDEELSHCVLSTIEYYEYKVLLELLGDKVRAIIPPFEQQDTFNMGLVKGADALSQEYIENNEIMKYVNDPKCTIILFENPPYAEAGARDAQKVKAHQVSWKKSYATTQMKAEVKNNSNIKGSVTNDLANIFIWSGFKYYLRQDTDSYVLYSPIKYWKSQHIINKEFLGGFGFNKRHFHATSDSFISAILWSNKNSFIEEIELDCYEIQDNKIIFDETLKVPRIYSSYSDLFDRREFDNDTFDGVILSMDGTEMSPEIIKEKQKSEGFSKKIRVKPLYNENMIGYLAAAGNNLENQGFQTLFNRAGCIEVMVFMLEVTIFCPFYHSSRGGICTV
ncbi:hypothetical protein [Mycoplasma nasistruthionis]|uniref:hypothetical protein n=1 Tax=Mycoplasma nasistruthionis TaxID=353852 RepID=UPI001C555AD6|nr:hypothetical protein [Mycoplasma nasistruthionis]